jgi:hypothetical protein
MWMPETREMRSIGGTAEVSNWSGFAAPAPETPLGRLGGVVVAGGTITAAGAGEVVVPFGDGVAVGVADAAGVAPGLGVDVGSGVEVGCAVGVGFGVGVGDPDAVTVSVVEPDEAAKFSSPG